jgi:asparagine synthase (glutamine-hydrolysing)
MASIHGWCGLSAAVDDPRNTIKLILQKCGVQSDKAFEYNFTDHGGCAVTHGIYPTSFYQNNSINVAIIGSPTWSDNSLTDRVKTQGLAASLVQAYQHYGVGLLTKLHGPFAIAIVQGNNSLIAIDRIGIHSLSYATQDEAFIFSSSSLGVTSHPLINSGINAQGVFNYFYFYDIPSPGTIHSGVEKLLPAQYVQFKNGVMEKGFYWNLKYNDSNQLSFHEERDKLDHFLQESIESVSSDGPTATFLSGGIDSSTITGLLARISPETVNAYTMGFGAEGFDEMEYARLAARHFRANINEYYIQPDDILEAIPIIVRSYDEPFGNESAVPAYFCAKNAAADGFKVMLGGDGGDEIFGGNERYAKQMVFEHYTKVPSSIRKSLIEPLVFGFPGRNSITPLRKLKSYITQANTPLPKRLEAYNFILRQSLDTIFHEDLLAAVDPTLPEALLNDTYFRADSNHPIHRMLHLDMKFTLADNDLRKVSRMCEAAGVEVRYPLLNEKLVEYSGQLPTNFKVRQHKLRWFFKQAMKNFLPDEIIKKRKHGFGLPFGVWALTHPGLNHFMNETLDRFQDRRYLQVDYIQTIRRLHANEHPTYYGKMIWLMLILEQWLEAHSDTIETR